jgi:hypothetical protein
MNIVSCNPYVSSRNIKTYLMLKLGCKELADIIYEYYKNDCIETSRHWYLDNHNPYITSTMRDSILTKVGRVDFGIFWKYMNPRLYYLEDIKMIGHPDFISKTKRDLSNVGCDGLFNTLTIEYLNSNESYLREIYILTNEERLPLSLFEKLHIVKCIQKYSKHYLEKRNMNTEWCINEVMYNHYLKYIQPNLKNENMYNQLLITGYLVDSKNVIYGM